MSRIKIETIIDNFILILLSMYCLACMYTIVWYHFYFSFLYIKTSFIYIYIQTSWFAFRVLNTKLENDVYLCMLFMEWHCYVSSILRAKIVAPSKGFISFYRWFLFYRKVKLKLTAKHEGKFFFLSFCAILWTSNALNWIRELYIVLGYIARAEPLRKPIKNGW